MMMLVEALLSVLQGLLRILEKYIREYIIIIIKMYDSHQMQLFSVQCPSAFAAQSSRWIDVVVGGLVGLGLTLLWNRLVGWPLFGTQSSE